MRLLVLRSLIRRLPVLRLLVVIRRKGGRHAQVLIAHDKHQDRRNIAKENAQNQKQSLIAGVAGSIQIIEADIGEDRSHHCHHHQSQHEKDQNAQNRKDRIRINGAHSQQDHCQRRNGHHADIHTQQQLAAIFDQAVSLQLIVISDGAQDPHIAHRHPCQPGVCNATTLGNGVHTQALQHIKSNGNQRKHSAVGGVKIHQPHEFFHRKTSSLYLWL